MAEMTDERLEELLRLYTANWKVFPKDFYDEYWNELWPHVDLCVKRLCKKNKSFFRAREVAPAGPGLDGLLSVSVAKGADPKLSKFREKHYGAAPGWLTNVCKNWLKDLRDLSDGKGKYNRQELDVDDPARHGDLYAQAEIKVEADDVRIPHFGLTANATDMDTALDAADAEASGKDFFHVIALIAIYSRIVVDAFQISEHGKRKIKRDAQVLVQNCVQAMHVHWGREPLWPGSSDSSRISTGNMVEIFKSIGIKGFGTSSDSKATNMSYRQIISRCTTSLRKKCAELFPLDCHN